MLKRTKNKSTRFRKLVILLFLIISSETFLLKVHSQSLLWKISRGDLEAASYLYGTIHIKDKRVLEEVREDIWHLYRDLKDYRVNPDKAVKLSLEERFDELFTRKTGFISLDKTLKRIYKNKSELLLVLERPDIPLHNNLSESDIREYVKRRKISGSTRSDTGK